jgi:bacterioferritin
MMPLKLSRRRNMLSRDIHSAAVDAGFSKYSVEMEGAQGATPESVIAKINDDISHLYAAAIQYNNHAALLEGPPWASMVEDLKGHAHDDFGQAQELSGRVKDLGGSPTTEVSEVKVSSTSSEMIEIDRATQKASVARYKERLPELLVLQEYGLAKYYQELIVHEEEHLSKLETLMGPKQPPEVSDEGIPEEYLPHIQMLRKARNARKELYISL